MTLLEEKLAGVDQALAELGKSAEEISEVRGRFARAEPLDLQAVDGEISTLSEGISIQRTPAGKESWEDEHTEVEIIDESDFVLLVDEDDLEELEKVGEDDALKTRPPAIPQDGEEDEDDDGFFRKLFSGRRSSNRP